MSNKNNTAGLFAFVLMPFKKDQRDIYRLGIKEPCANVSVVAERVDEQMYEEGILQRIYSQIHRADFIIAELTEKNPNVFYELGFAQAIGKICLLLTKDAESIPFDLRHQRHIVYDDIVSLKDQLLENIVWIKNTLGAKKKHVDGNAVHALVEALNNDLNAAEVSLLPLYRYELIKNVINDAADEVKGVIKGVYSLDIGLERSFLLRAEPIFRNAKSICAVSLSWISEFWVDQKNIDLSRKYLSSQPKFTRRLFVFLSPDEANHFKMILKANYDQYGKEGAVYICSVDKYEDLLTDMGVDYSGINDYLEKDFGFLSYDYEADNIYVEAQLDDTKLEFRQIVRKESQKHVYKNISELFDGFSMRKDGLVSEKYKIFKWTPDLYTNHVRWADVLKEMFGDRSRSIYHFVYFKDLHEEINQIVQELKYELEDIKKRLSKKCDIDIIWFGRHVDILTKDGRFYGKIEVSKEYKYVLVMRFPSRDDLEVYYTDMKHSESRENMYCKFDMTIKYLYSLIKQCRDKKTSDNMEKLFAAIEGLAAKYVVRMDFEDYENIDEISKKEGRYFSA